jgi:predicted metal-binding protein
MESFLEILKYTIPSLVVFVTAYLLIGSVLANDQKRRKLEAVLQNQKFVTPIRLQAYERIILLLERISPESLVMRLNTPGIISRQLQSDMLAAIRAEFEHNFSQQVYITAESWAIVKNAKNNVIKMVNLASDRVGVDSPGINLSKAILEMMMEAEKSPTDLAIDFLKKEIQQLF